MGQYILGKSLLFLCFTLLNAVALGIFCALLDSEQRVPLAKALFQGALKVTAATWLLRSLLSPLPWIAGLVLFAILAVPALIAVLAYREKPGDKSIFHQNKDRLCKAVCLLTVVNLAAGLLAPGASF